MPAFDPIDIPSFAAEKYQDEIKTIKNYFTEALPNSVVEVAYSIDLNSIGFRISDNNSYNVVFFKSIFLEYLDSPLTTWLASSGIKEFIAMNNEATLMVEKTGELQLRMNL
jgi:hypothetical protein